MGGGLPEDELGVLAEVLERVEKLLRVAQNLPFLSRALGL